MPGADRLNLREPGLRIPLWLISPYRQPKRLWGNQSCNYETTGGVLTPPQKSAAFSAWLRSALESNATAAS